MTNTEVSQALDVTINTITNVSRSFQNQRLEAIERKKPNREYEHSIDGEVQRLAQRFEWQKHALG